MPNPGDVVIVDFPGAEGVKRRPAVVVSTDLYHLHRPDVMFELLTTKTTAANSPTSYMLMDWAEAGLRKWSSFRAYLVMIGKSDIHSFAGHLSQRDWHAIQQRMMAAISTLSADTP